jgi:hypothetical protein
MSRVDERQRAKALKAADARDLLKKALPAVLPQMTAEQVDKVQRVLDMAVVNPAVDKEVADLNRKAIRSQSGSVVHRDPEIVERVNKAMQKYIMLSKLNGPDWRVRIDFENLLTADALKPTTDNPDETAYLVHIKARLMNQGVWLRFHMGLRQDFDDPMYRAFDSRSFEAWLSLGPDGDNGYTIETVTGSLTRKALIGTPVLGAGYYDAVHRGPTELFLQTAMNGVQNKIAVGRREHADWAQHRKRQMDGVVRWSDALGGARFPSEDIWDLPQQLLVKARNLNVGGNVNGASAHVVVAAVQTAMAAKALAEFIEDTTRGAGRALTVLKIAETAGMIAEVILVVRMVGRGVWHLLTRKKSATSAGSGAGASTRRQGAPRGDRRPEAFHNTNLDRVPEVYRNTVQEAGKNVTLDSTGAGAARVMTRNELAYQRDTQEYIEYVSRELRALMQRNPNASLADKTAIIDRADARWGSWLPGD